MRAPARACAARSLALASAGTQPEQLHTIDAVLKLQTLDVQQPDDNIDRFWALEQLYVEAAPGPNPPTTAGAPLPEPATGLLIALGLAGLVNAGRRRPCDV